jgi:hypothetical protein
MIFPAFFVAFAAARTIPYRSAPFSLFSPAALAQLSTCAMFFLLNARNPAASGGLFVIQDFRFLFATKY